MLDHSDVGNFSDEDVADLSIGVFRYRGEALRFTPAPPDEAAALLDRFRHWD